jgi:hypothetical protein
MGFESRLDLERRQILAAPPDDFFLTPHEGVGAVVVDAYQVARAKPAIRQNRARFFGHVVVAPHCCGILQL